MNKTEKPRKEGDIGHKLNLVMQGLIILSIIQLTLETLPSFHARYGAWWHLLEIFFVTVFTIEYALRIFYAENRLKFALSFYGIVDLLSILPSLITLGLVDLRFVRSLRFLRLLRLLKLARYTTALDRLKNAFKEILADLMIFTILTLITLFISASGIYYFENEAQPDVFQSIPHSLWWAVTTLSTVGYGDAYPVTVGGKIFTFFVLMIGLGIVAIPAGLIAGALARKR